MTAEAKHRGTTTLLQILLLAVVSSAGATSSATDIPVIYQAGHVIAEPRTPDGQVLKLLVDTGGGGSSGMYLLTDETAKRLHLKTSRLTQGKQSFPVAELPTFAAGASIPPPRGKYAKAMLLPANNSTSFSEHYDGMLGGGYLPGNDATHDRVWTFDYPGRHLTLQGADWHPAKDAQSTLLHFPVNAHGHLESGFPRIVMHVDGKPLSLLLDTGASGYPTTAGIAAQGGSARERATSYITTCQLERWHKEHPQWRVVENADRLRISGKSMRAIEVPAMVIAGWRAGPMWFTERPDTAFRDFMSSMTDKPVEGALGGNLFKHFVMTVDYDHAKAWFRCVRGCTAAAPSGS